ncbi:hypothetical protein BC834DRAFT_902566, partial [Gloeopeniophorella convolvens]
MGYSTAPRTADLIQDLNLISHPEGGYFAETDRQEVEVPSPYASGAPRSLATTIFYLLTASSPVGVIHTNKSIVCDPCCLVISPSTDLSPLILVTPFPALPSDDARAPLWTRRIHSYHA